MKPVIINASHDAKITEARSLTAEEVASVHGGYQVGGSVLGQWDKNHAYEIGVTGSSPELGHVLATRSVMVVQDGVIMNRDELGLI